MTPLKRRSFAGLDRERFITSQGFGRDRPRGMKRI